MSDTEHSMQKHLFQNISLIIFNNFNHDQLAVKTKLKCLKRQLSNQIIEKWSSGVSKWHHMSDNGMVCKSSFSKYSPYPIQQHQPWSTWSENQVKRLKTAIKWSKYWKMTKWHLNDVISLTLGTVCKEFFSKYSRASTGHKSIKNHKICKKVEIIIRFHKISQSCYKIIKFFKSFLSFHKFVQLRVT